MEFLRQIWKNFLSFIERYSILVAGVVIYVYYLLTSIDLLKHADTKRSFLDYLLQFDSLILLWVIAVVVLQLQKYRRQHREQEETRQRIQLEYERQRTQLQVLDEITTLLHDNINNPLAIISMTTQSIRRKFETDPEIISWIERIDSALQRVQTAIKDIKAYQTQKIVEETLSATNKSQRRTPTEKV